MTKIKVPMTIPLVSVIETEHQDTPARQGDFRIEKTAATTLGDVVVLLDLFWYVLEGVPSIVDVFEFRTFWIVLIKPLVDGDFDFSGHWERHVFVLSCVDRNTH